MCVLKRHKVYLEGGSQTLPRWHLPPDELLKVYFKDMLIAQLHSYIVVYESKVSKKSNVSVNEKKPEKN